MIRGDFETDNDYGKCNHLIIISYIKEKLFLIDSYLIELAMSNNS